MSWQNQSGGGKNPWGSGGSGSNGGGSGGGPRNPWGNGSNNNGGGRGPGRPGGEPPDLDDVLRKMQDGLRQAMPGGIGGGGKFVGLFGAAVVALWLASGFYIIEPGEYGVVQRFGAWNRTQVTEGLSYRAPWPVEIVNKVNVSEIRRMPIGFTEAGGNRRGAAQDLPEESQMLTSDANIVDLDLVVLWNIKSAEEFVFNIADPEGTIKKVAESAIREVVGQTLMFPIITQDRESVAQRAREIMTANLDAYKSGINISQVLILEAEVHPDVQEAFQDVQSAKQDAIDVQNRAQAYRQDILPRARGEAIKVVQEAKAYEEATVARAVGDSTRFGAVYDAYLTGKDVTRTRMFLETMEQVMQNADKIIMDDKAQGSGVIPYLPLNELRPAAGGAQSAPARGTSVMENAQ